MVHAGIIAPDGGRESFGVALVEASAASLPIVSVRVGGIPEIVSDGETGLLTEVGDVEGMAERVITLATDRQLRESFGEAARLRALEKFDSQTQVSRLEEFYQGLLAGGRG